MMPSCYNIEVAYSLPDTDDDADADMDAILANYAKGHEAIWFASDCNPRTGKRCNCYQSPFTKEGAQAAAMFIAGLPQKFNIDEVGLIRRHGGQRTFAFMFPYPRENMRGDAVYDVLNATHPVRRLVGTCLRMVGM